MVTVRQIPAWLDMCLDGFAAIAGGDAVLTWRVVFQIGPSPMQMRLSRFAQFLAVCSRLKWSRHLTKSPCLALLAMDGSKAAYQIISACSHAVSCEKLR